MKRGRLWHQFRAWFGGYFWLPCPLCREPFGGHEWRAGDALAGTHHSGTGKLVCPKCGDDARKLAALLK